MITESILGEEQLIRQATDVLIDKLGIVETMRFFALKNLGHEDTDAVIRHRLWQNNLNKDEFFDEIFSNIAV